MALLSEKFLYEKRVNEELAWIDADYILWGEELYNTTIILYPKKISDIPRYQVFRHRLCNAGVVYFDHMSDTLIKNTVVRYDPDSRILYVSAGNFNALWRYFL